MRRAGVCFAIVLTACGGGGGAGPDAGGDDAPIDAGLDAGDVADAEAPDAAPPEIPSIRIGDTCYAICQTDSDPDGDGWGWEHDASCVTPTNPLATSEPWCDTPLPQVAYEATPAVVTAATTSVAVIPRPPVVAEPAPTGCPHDDPTLAAWDPAWIHADGMVHVPDGVRALVRGNVDLPAGTLIKHLMIPATSELVFDDVDATFRVRDVEVMGAMRLGSATCRLQQDVTFELDTDEDVTSASVRDAIFARAGLGIVVHVGGVLEVYGKLFQPTWTRLGATAAAGATQLQLAEAVDWEPGQQLVVTTSTRRDYPFTDQNEIRTITSVTSGTTIAFAQPLVHRHHGGVEYQVEVGLLSRNLVFRTAASVLAAAPTFGGHIMSHAADVRISGAELYGLGQQNFVGRYPFHLHRAGDVTDHASFTDSSIWRSNWRCAVVHRTDGAVVSRNVAFDVWGHCYYLEDGVERNNDISFNLAARTKILGPVDQPALDALAVPSQTGFTLLQSDVYAQPADRAAAGFYLTNGNNRVVGNAASGGFAGYSLPNLPRAIGGSDERIFPIRYGASHFDGNTAHSAGYFWPDSGCVYAGGILREVDDGGVTKLEYTSGRTTDSALLRHAGDVYNNTKTFLCETGITHWGSRVRVINTEAWDNGLLAKLFGAASIHGALAAADTTNTTVPIVRPLNWWKRGFQFYDTSTQTILHDVVFRDFHVDPTAGIHNSWDSCALLSMNHSDQWTPQRMNATARIFYANVDESQRLCHDDTGTLSSRNFNLIDTDGTATAFSGDGIPAGPRLVGSGYADPWNTGAGCVRHAAWGLWVCPLTGTRSVASIRVVPNDDVRVEMYDLDGVSRGETWYSGASFWEAQISGPSELGWHHEFPDGDVPDSFAVEALQVPASSFALLSFTLPAGVSCSISGWTAAPDLDALLAATGAAYTTDQQTCFVRVPPTEVGSFTASGLSIPNQTWRGSPSPTTYFTVITGCDAGNALCDGVVSTLPAMQ